MSLLKVTGLSQSYMDKVLYESTSFELYNGEHIGVVGQNGAGKSTFIKILTGEIIPDQGRIQWQSNIKIGHLDQYAGIQEDITISNYLRTAFAELFAIEKEMTQLYEKSAVTGDEKQLIQAANYQEQLINRNFYSIDVAISKVTHGLGIDAVGVDRIIKELSGGQRAKVILAKILLETPDIILLDEPTNFLDKEHVEWLAAYLSAFEGAYIVVSHDFDFLEKISSGICDIEFATIKKYHGKYSQFVKQKAHLRENYIRQYQSQKKKIEKTEAYIRKNIAGVNSRIAQGRRKQLERMERIAPPAFTEKPSIRFCGAELLTQTALIVTELEVGYYFPLLPKLNFSVAGGQKIVITGFNGIGKSTLLKTLVKHIDKISGEFRFSEQVRIGYYEQDLKWDTITMTPLQILSDSYPAIKTKELRRALAKCGVKNDHVQQEIGTLSGGEQSKVKLCKMLLSPCNFLILDEPTNHLDADTKAELQQALREFQGSVVLVSHEEKFYKDWVDKVIHIGACFI